MAQLDINAPDGKTLSIDVPEGTDPTQYDALVDHVVQDYMASQPQDKSVSGFLHNAGTDAVNIAQGFGNLAEGLTTHPIDTATNVVKAIPDMAQDMYQKYGIKDLVHGHPLDAAGQFLDTAYEKPVSSALDVASVAIPALKGAKALGAGEFAADAVNAARNAGADVAENIAERSSSMADNLALRSAGVTKKSLMSLGEEGRSGLADFLNNSDLASDTLKPGEEAGTVASATGDTTVPGTYTPKPVITAFGSTEDSLAKVAAARTNAGQVIGDVSKTIDTTLPNSLQYIDANGLMNKIEGMKAEFEKVAPNLSKTVIGQYDTALNDVYGVLAHSLEDGSMPFSDLAELKSRLGDLVYKHGNPIESKEALRTVERAVSETLDDAVKQVSLAHPEHAELAANYAKAKNVYTNASHAMDALEGKQAGEISKPFFNMGSFGAGALAYPHGVIPAIGAAVGESLIAPKLPQIATVVARNFPKAFEWLAKRLRPAGEAAEGIGPKLPPAEGFNPPGDGGNGPVLPKSPSPISGATLDSGNKTPSQLASEYRRQHLNNPADETAGVLADAFDTHIKALQENLPIIERALQAGDESGAIASDFVLKQTNPEYAMAMSEFENSMKNQADFNQPKQPTTSNVPRLPEKPNYLSKLDSKTKSRIQKANDNEKIDRLERDLVEPEGDSDYTSTPDEEERIRDRDKPETEKKKPVYKWAGSLDDPAKVAPKPDYILDTPDDYKVKKRTKEYFNEVTPEGERLRPSGDYTLDEQGTPYQKLNEKGEYDDVHKIKEARYPRSTNGDEYAVKHLRERYKAITDRQAEIMELLNSHVSVEDIATELDMSKAMVYKHLKHIKEIVKDIDE